MNMQTWQTYRTTLLNQPEALERLRHAADASLAIKRLSVVDKKAPPRGGSLHDYTSMGPYWWPDPAKPDGLPYIRRDGRPNPETKDGDRQALHALCTAVSSLINRAWVDDSPGRSDSEAHARQAGMLLRAWFLDPETRMNPSLRFAQSIPGRTDGRGIGIIDTTAFCFLLDELGLFEQMADSANWPAGVWTDKDRAGMRQWFSDYVDWLLTSKNGKDEAREHNNHGTWYDAQVATYAMFCGRAEVARSQIDGFARQRIAAQIFPDGSQPHELARTKSFNYSVFNLLAFCVVARVDELVPPLPKNAGAASPALWNWRAENGAGIVPALDWLQPYLRGEKPWTHQQIEPYSGQPTAAWLYHLAGRSTGDSTYIETAKKLAHFSWEKISFFCAGIPRE